MKTCSKFATKISHKLRLNHCISEGAQLWQLKNGQRLIAAEGQVYHLLLTTRRSLSSRG